MPRNNVERGRNYASIIRLIILMVPGQWCGWAANTHSGGFRAHYIEAIELHTETGFYVTY